MEGSQLYVKVKVGGLEVEAMFDVQDFAARGGCPV